MGLIAGIAFLLLLFAGNDSVTSLKQIPIALAISVVVGFLVKWLGELAAWKRRLDRAESAGDQG